MIVVVDVKFDQMLNDEESNVILGPDTTRRSAGTVVDVL